MSSRLRRLLPLLVAVSALAFVASRTDLQRLQAALAHAPLGLFCAVSVVFTVINCAADTLAMYYVFRWFGLHLRYFDLYTIRAATSPAPSWRQATPNRSHSSPSWIASRATPATNMPGGWAPTMCP